jgi:hypothetical protein
LHTLAAVSSSSSSSSSLGSSSSSSISSSILNGEDDGDGCCSNDDDGDVFEHELDHRLRQRHRGLEGDRDRGTRILSEMSGGGSLYSSIYNYYEG